MTCKRQLQQRLPWLPGSRRDTITPLWTPSIDQPRVVIVGAGFGGLQAARHWVMRRCASPSLTGRTITCSSRCSIGSPRLAFRLPTSPRPFAAFSGGSKNTEVILAEVTGVDVENRRVLMGEHYVPYDYLIAGNGRARQLLWTSRMGAKRAGTEINCRCHYHPAQDIARL